MKLQPRPLSSSLGTKYLMAITGVMLIGFVLTHMAGNLLFFAGPDALNSYAHGLKARPYLLWPARAGLLAVFVLHLLLALRLKWQNSNARPVKYEYEDTLQASWASRHMLLTGLVLLAFVVFHLAHYTFGVVEQAEAQVIEGKKVEITGSNKKGQARPYLDLAETRPVGRKDFVPSPASRLSDASRSDVEARHDVYSMVVNGFTNWLIVGPYLVAMLFLALHLWHGGSSWLQSLGLNSSGWRGVVGFVGPALALVVFVGNCSIPLYVLFKYS